MDSCVGAMNHLFAALEVMKYPAENTGGGLSRSLNLQCLYNHGKLRRNTLEPCIFLQCLLRASGCAGQYVLLGYLGGGEASWGWRGIPNRRRWTLFLGQVFVWLFLPGKKKKKVQTAEVGKCYFYGGRCQNPSLPPAVSLNSYFFNASLFYWYILSRENDLVIPPLKPVYCNRLWICFVENF